jgi:hypothetical protein
MSGSPFHIRCSYCNRRIPDIGKATVVLIGHDWYCNRRHRRKAKDLGDYRYGYPWLRWLRRVL